MAKYYILIKRRGAKNWLGAIPVKAGVSLKRLRSVLRKQIRRGYIAKIVSQAVLKRYLTKLVKRRRAVGRRAKRRHVVRRRKPRRVKRRIVRRKKPRRRRR